MHLAAFVFILSLTHGGLPGVGSIHNGRSASHLTTHHHRRHWRHWRRIVFFSPIKGSHESLLRQNQKASEDDLERIQDDAQLAQLTQSKELVSLPVNRSLTVDSKLPEERRYCRPWTANFLENISKTYYAAFKGPLQVNSAVRTVEFQEKLRRHNHNAAPEDGDTASPHLTGATIDIAKRGMSRKQLTWTRMYLLKLQNMGLVDAEEEFHQRVFHITVYRDYGLAQTETADSVGPVKARIE